MGGGGAAHGPSCLPACLRLRAACFTLFSGPGARFSHPKGFKGHCVALGWLMGLSGLCPPSLVKQVSGLVETQGCRNTEVPLCGWDTAPPPGRSCPLDSEQQVQNLDPVPLGSEQHM